MARSIILFAKHYRGTSLQLTGPPKTHPPASMSSHFHNIIIPTRVVHYFYPIQIHVLRGGSFSIAQSSQCDLWILNHHESGLESENSVTKVVEYILQKMIKSAVDFLCLPVLIILL